MGTAADVPRGTGLAGASSRALNLGCGRKHIAGAVNVDCTARSAPDVVHDLDVLPWPFEYDRFDRVYAFDVVEHLADVVKTMEELHRVCRSGARIEITVPHFSCANAFTDPTHRHFFSRGSFEYFQEAHAFGFYSRARFAVVRATIVFKPSLLNRVVSRLANRFPDRYESRWAWMFPAWFLSVELQVVKAPGSERQEDADSRADGLDVRIPAAAGEPIVGDVHPSQARDAVDPGA